MNARADIDLAEARGESISRIATAKVSTHSNAIITGDKPTIASLRRDVDDFLISCSMVDLMSGTQVPYSANEALRNLVEAIMYDAAEVAASEEVDRLRAESLADRQIEQAAFVRGVVREPP